MSDSKQIILYKRDGKGRPIYWKATILGNKIILNYGIVGKEGTTSSYIPPRGVEKEWKTIVAAKRREGGMELSELYDNAPEILTGKDLINYLNDYLPKFNTSNEGFVLPMKAKIYEFDGITNYIGQTKINGVRCNMSASIDNNGMFESPKINFFSISGLRYKCPLLETYMLETLPSSILLKMIDENYILDGELYIPNATLNQILSAVETPSNPLNKLVQFWCYDLAIPDMIQVDRLNWLERTFSKYRIPNYNDARALENFHCNNKKCFVLCANYSHTSSDEAIIQLRNTFVSAGFEGLILRNPYATYQFGARNKAMFKVKPVYDGKFRIVNIVPEGAKRPEFSKFILKNDTNEEEFECMPIGDADTRKNYLVTRESLIGKLALVEYRSRSGVKDCPYHANVIKVIN